MKNLSYTFFLSDCQRFESQWTMEVSLLSSQAHSSSHKPQGRQISFAVGQTSAFLDDSGVRNIGESLSKIQTRSLVTSKKQ